MIYWNGQNWEKLNYKIIYMVETFGQTLDGFPENATAEEITLSTEQQARLNEIKNIEMTENEAIAYVKDGVGEIPDNRSEVDKLIEKIIELDPDSPETKDLVTEATKIWVPGENYGRFVYVKFDGVVYKTSHPIRGQIDMMTPPERPDLYTRIGAISGGEIAIEEWRQPTGEHDAYKIGDKVLHKGQTWVCTLGDGAGLNSWEPGVYGWEVVV